MYDPLALDRQRIELERLRRRTETAPLRPARASREDQESTGRHLRIPGRSRRRPAAAC
jgi:hypothetical protein